jgi:hypothetical protein
MGKTADGNGADDPAQVRVGTVERPFASSWGAVAGVAHHGRRLLRPARPCPQRPAGQVLAMLPSRRVAACSCGHVAVAQRPATSRKCCGQLAMARPPAGNCCDRLTVSQPFRRVPSRRSRAPAPCEVDLCFPRYSLIVLRLSPAACHFRPSALPSCSCRLRMRWGNTANRTPQSECLAMGTNLRSLLHDPVALIAIRALPPGNERSAGERLPPSLVPRVARGALGGP